MSSFTDDFVAYTREFTDCPENLLQWSAYHAISCVLGRKVYLELGDKHVVPNLWLIFVGPSSIHKSTALRIASRIVKGVLPDIFLAQEWSHEKLIADIQAQPHSCLLYDEVRGFFDGCEKDYNAGAMSALTTLFEEPEYKRRTKQETIEIQDAYILFGGASTPEWITSGLRHKSSAILSGFLPRFLLVSSPKRQDRIIAFQPRADYAKRQRLVDRLRQIAQARGPVSYTPEAKAAYISWYERFHRALEQADPLCSPFLNKLKTVYSHRLAIVSAANLGTLPHITLDAWKEVELLTGFLERTLPELIVDNLTATHADRARQKIKLALSQAGSMKWSDLSNTVRIFGDDLRGYVRDLEMAGLVKQDSQPTATNPGVMVHWVVRNGA